MRRFLIFDRLAIQVVSDKRCPAPIKKFWDLSNYDNIEFTLVPNAIFGATTWGVSSKIAGKWQTQTNGQPKEKKNYAKHGETYKIALTMNQCGVMTVSFGSSLQLYMSY